MSGLAALWSYTNISDKARSEFQSLTERTALEMETRFKRPVYGLNGLKGVLATHATYSRENFREAVSVRNLPVEFPGVRGFGYIERVQKEELEDYLVAARADGAPDFAMHQLADLSHSDLFVIRQIEPPGQNVGAQGLDLGSEMVRRAAAEKAMDSGTPAITGAITLVQDNKKTPGVLIFVPVYRNNKTLTDVPSRRSSLAGWLYAPIVIQELLANIPDVQSGLLDFEVFDSALGAPDGGLMFDADGHTQKPAHSGDLADEKRRFSSRHALNLPGRQFTISMNSTARFEAQIDRFSPILIFAGGTLLSLMLFALVRAQANSKRNAEKLASAMTEDLDRLAKVVKYSSNAAILYDLQGVITWVNEGFTRLTGYRQDEAVGKTIAELVGSPNGNPASIRKLSEAQAKGHVCRVEILNRAKDGQEYWIDTEIQPQFDANRNIVGFMEIGTDITALRQTQIRMELAQREADVLLGTLNLHAIVSVANRAGVITDVNDAFCNISGYTREFLIGKTHRVVNSGVHPPEFFIEMWQDIAKGLPWRGQVCNRARDGHLYWVDTFIASYMGDDGIAEKYVSIRIDITANKLAELELRRVEASLRANVTMLDSVMENLPCGLSVFDSDLNLRASNREFRRLLELPDTVDGEPLSRFDDIIQYNAGRGEYGTTDVETIVRNIVDRARAPAVKHQFERVRPNDTALEIRGGPMPGGGFITTYTDISKRHRVQLENERITDALVHATKEAQEASKSKSQFLANMSHEIRTPMNAILGMLALLLKTSLTARQEDYASKAEGAARALLGLLNEILDFSKIEANKMTLDPQPFQLDKLLRDLSVIVSAYLGAKKLEVLFDIDPQTPRYLIGDAMRLQQVLVNLTGNAIKFTPSGTVVLSIAVVNKEEHKVSLEFAVQDSGIGIAPENHERIFSGFTQAEASTTRKFGGTGLGVAISQRLVSLMGGKLQLKSAVDQGSRFYFEIDLPYQNDAGNAPPILGARRLLEDTGNAKPARVLVVDDNAAALEVMSVLCRSMGWDVDAVNSGESALALLNDHAGQGESYTAIFLDWHMPGMDGWQTCRAIRSIGLFGTEPALVMVTSSTKDMLSERTEDDRAMLDGFLVKPVTASMLMDSMGDARSQRHQTEPSRAALAPGAERLKGLRLLLVEDNANNQQIACELLQLEGALIHIANNGQEAIDALESMGSQNVQEPEFDAVLMDLQMPVMDGLTASRHIREVLNLRDLPIIAMTANAMDSDRDACLAAGMNGHVGKPFELDALVKVLLQFIPPRWHRQDERIGVPPAAGQSFGLTALDDAVRAAARAADVNLSGALNRLGNNVGLYQRSLRMFLDDLGAMPAQLTACLSAGDVAVVTRSLHTLKGLAATLGAENLAALAGQGEAELNDSAALSRLPAVVDRINTAIALAAPPLKALLESLALSQPASETPADSSPLDAEAFARALDSLCGKLSDFDMDAVQEMNQIRQTFGGAMANRNESASSGVPQLDALQAAIDALDFDQALHLCQDFLKLTEAH